MRLDVLTAEPWDDYALLDTGHGRKLERYGPHALIRPEPQALWAPASPEWQAAGEFTGGSDEDGGGRWRLDASVPASWALRRGPLTFTAAPTAFRHLAFFPDLAPQWDWLSARTRPGDEVLNLFGYTGLASLTAAAAGARVTHVDASRKAVETARANQRLSGLEIAPIRWIVDDALTFLRRETRRGRHYAGIIMDPPKYGRGPDGEVWDLARDLPELIALAAGLLRAESHYLILTVYAVRMSALAVGQAVQLACATHGGTVEAGDMGVREAARGLILPTAIYTRWAGGPATQAQANGPS